MLERYHVVLGVWALLAGSAAALGGRLGLVRPADRVLASAALAGALLGGWGVQRALPWVIAAAVAVAVASDDRWRHPAGRITVGLAVLSLVGVWSAVPDTEAPLAAAAALLPVAVVALVRGGAPGRGATAALVVAVVGSAWTGSAGRGWALASVAAVAMVLVAPVVLAVSGRSLRPGRSRRGGRSLLRSGVGLVATAHVAVALVLPRVLLRRPTGPAVLASTAVVVVLVAVTLVASERATGVVRASGGARGSGG